MCVFTKYKEVPTKARGSWRNHGVRSSEEVEGSWTSEELHQREEDFPGRLEVKVPDLGTAASKGARLDPRFQVR